MAEVRYEDWSSGPRSRIHEQMRALLLPAAQDLTRAPAQRTLLAQAVVALDAFDEAGNLALAKALSDAGRRAGAQALLRDFVRRLRAEFDEDASPELLAAAGAPTPATVKS